MPRVLQLTLAWLASAVLLWLAFPPVAAGPVVWVALAPVLAVLWRGAPVKARWAFVAGWLGGVVFFTLNLKWLRHVTPAFVLLALFLAVFPALWSAFAARLSRVFREKPASAVLLAAAGWTGTEWLRSVVFTGFPWNHLGAAAPLPWLEQAADVTGGLGLSFFIVAVQASVVAACLVPRPRRRGVLMAGCLPAVVATLYGVIRLASVEKEATNSVPVALVQANVPQDQKNLRENFLPMAQQLMDLTHQAVQATPKPALVVWSESSLPAMATDPTLVLYLQDLTAAIGSATVVFGIDQQEMDAYYNCMAVLRGDPAALQLHAKVHLVPFGEYLPARWLFGHFPQVTDLLPADFSRGESLEPLPTPEVGGSVLPLVCFEDSIGRVARRFVRAEPQVIVNVTNDAWYLDSEGADQHLTNARLRTIELRRPMIRSANTGVTCVIDAAGRLTSKLPRMEEGVLAATVDVPTGGALTVYSRVGELFSILLLAAAVLGGVLVRPKAA